MTSPERLIGLPYRLGADPERHGAADCLSLARHVVGHYGVTMPPAKRDWYRRLRRKDYSVFPEELSRWGTAIDEPRLGSVVLCKSSEGYGLGAYWCDGCLVFIENQVTWKRVMDLPVVTFYFPTKRNFVTP